MMQHLGAWVRWYKHGIERQPGKIIVAHNLASIREEDRHLLDGAHVFMVVRDPYSRCLSAWRHLLRKHKLSACLSSPPQWPSRLTWPDSHGLNKSEKKACSGYTHFTLCLRQNADLDGRPRCNTLLHLENFNEEMAAFIDEVGLTCSAKVNKVNSTSGKPHPWNLEERRMANELYRPDFEYLGYEMIEP